ncbi:hypothetical protein FQN49_002632 [Arthroderma sp. PD_2]|nr:hypothetical protein FQN49_002632 [Arthroderma sp. PD_2]
MKHDSLASLPVATNYRDRIICTKKLDTDRFQVQYYEPGERPPPPNSRLYEIRVQLQNVFRMGEVLSDLKSSKATYDSEEKDKAIQALNVIFAHYPNESPNTQFLGQSKHFPLGDEKNKKEIGAGLDAIRGFFHSVRPSTGGLLLNLNVSTGAFYNDGTLHGLVCKFDQSRRLTGSFRAFELDRFLRKLRVKTSYSKDGGRQVRTIQSLTRRDNVAGSIDTVRFEWSSGGRRREISVKDYYLQAYGINLTQSEQIVVDVGTKEKAVYLPAELCYVVSGQAARQRLSSRQTSEMIRVACRRPGPNANDIVRKGLPLMGVTPGTSGIHRLEDFGIRVVSKMLAVTGAVLPPPNLLYKSPMQVTRPGSWNLSRNVAFNQPGSIRTHGDVGCLVIAPPQSRSTIETSRFMEELGQYMVKYGINWPKGRASTDTLALTQNSIEDNRLFNDHFSRIKKSTRVFTIIVLPRYDAELYSQVKYFADVKYGCHTLCVVPKPPKNSSSGAPLEISTQPSYLANLALKINLKLGGVNHQLETVHNSQPLSRTMYLGIDVTHSTGTDSVSEAPSIAGVVANCDPMLGQWPASIRTQAHRVEMVKALSDMITERLKSWKDQKCLPDKIIVYRDGVSESQYKQVLDEELGAINDAIQSYYRNKRLPKVTLLIVGKRHHTRQVSKLS